MNNDKYLIYRIPFYSKAGLDHLLAEFKGAIKEAVHWGRILVIEKQLLHAMHNFNYKLEGLDISQYINLEKTQVYTVEENGSVRQINNSFRYIYAEDFNIDDYPKEQVLFTEGRIVPVTKEQNEKYKVIIRETDKYNYPDLYLDIVVSFYPSDEVERLTDVVLKTMGTSLADAKRLSAVYRDVDFSSNRDVFQQKILNNPSYYGCLHVRGGDTQLLQYRHHIHFRFAASRTYLNNSIKRMLQKGIRIYIMSDIRKPHYFDFLKQDYTVYQYHDFSELRALVSGDNGKQIDNAMLYSVEKNIFQYANIKMVRSNRTPKLIYTNVIHNIPIWYKFYEYCRYKKMQLKNILTK